MRRGRTTPPKSPGVAYVEALVVLPVFFAALAAVVALNNMYEAKLEAKARARRLAWLQADSGECPTRSCTSGCEVAEEQIRTGGLDGVLSVHADGRALAPFLEGWSGHLLGRATQGIGIAEAALPGMMGGSTVQTAHYTLLCNPGARTAGDGRGVLDYACASELDELEYAREVCR